MRKYLRYCVKLVLGHQNLFLHLLQNLHGITNLHVIPKLFCTKVFLKQQLPRACTPSFAPAPAFDSKSQSQMETCMTILGIQHVDIEQGCRVQYEFLLICIICLLIEFLCLFHFLIHIQSDKAIKECIISLIWVVVINMMVLHLKVSELQIVHCIG